MVGRPDSAVRSGGHDDGGGSLRDSWRADERWDVEDDADVFVEDAPEASADDDLREDMVRFVFWLVVRISFILIFPVSCVRTKGPMR